MRRLESVWSVFPHSERRNPEKTTAALVCLPIGGAVTDATPSILPHRHLRQPVQPWREIRVNACKIFIID
ncbi:hypothetical protein U1Q18_018819 [Sarracenia purpurea var. burkii]